MLFRSEFTVFPYQVDVNFTGGTGNGGSVSTTSPDLLITSAQTSATKIDKTQSLTFSFTLKNGGKLTAGASVARIYAGDVLLASIDCNALAAGASQQYTYYIPAGTLPEGIQYLRVTADAGGSVAEYNEANNTSVAVPVQVNNDPLPDLVVSNISLEQDRKSVV